MSIPRLVRTHTVCKACKKRVVPVHNRDAYRCDGCGKEWDNFVIARDGVPDDLMVGEEWTR